MLSRHSVQELRPRNTGAIRPGNQTREKRGNTQQICYSFGSPVTTRQDPIPCSSISFRSIWIYSFGQEFSYYHPSVGRIRGRSSWSDKTSSWVKKSMEWQIYTSNEITSLTIAGGLRHEIRWIGVQTDFKWLLWFLAKATFKLMRVHRMFTEDSFWVRKWDHLLNGEEDETQRSWRLCRKEMHFRRWMQMNDNNNIRGSG